MKKVLKYNYQLLLDEFNDNFSGGNCSCHLNPPCSSCTHEGNPLNLEETPEAWEFIDDESD